MWTIFNFIEFVIISLCFMFWFCGYKGCGILAPWPGIKPAYSAQEGKAQPLNHQGIPKKTMLLVGQIREFWLGAAPQSPG